MGISDRSGAEECALLAYRVEQLERHYGTLITGAERREDRIMSLSQQVALADLRVTEIEKLKPDVDMLKRYLWIGFGALGAIELVLGLLRK